MIAEQLQLKLSQQRALVASLESDLAGARRRFDSACIASAGAPAGFTDRQADAEDENIKHYAQKLHGARLVLEQMQAEQAAPDFQERVELADRLLGEVQAESFMAELERTYGPQLSQLGAAMAGIYQQTFAAIQHRQRRAAEAMAAAKAVGGTIEDGPRLFGSLLDVHALIARAFWSGVRDALPVRTNVDDPDLLVSLRGVLQRNQ
ncbi:MAG: hypothetical protein JW940_00505 [Polyangiaceae bacterium]|nr:hypothetical protein [Polyangiaceae bacterium]